jgi:hypothetical protein
MLTLPAFTPSLSVRGIGIKNDAIPRMSTTKPTPKSSFMGSLLSDVDYCKPMEKTLRLAAKTPGPPKGRGDITATEHGKE